MSDEKFAFNHLGIGEVLSTRKLGVPIYQRSYAWGSDDPKERNQVTEFWEDLRDSLERGDTEYFLGTIVLSGESPDPHRSVIIDGQQRLATATILFAAIRDEFTERGDSERADIVQHDVIARKTLATASAVPQLTLNADDNSFFREFIIDGKTEIDPHTESQELIAAAYRQLLERIRADAGAAGSGSSDRLISWTDFLTNRVRAIVVDVPTEADAYLIFETLNDRGADLTIADLLKNYLFRRSGTQLDTVRNAWVTSLANLDISAGGSQVFTDFLRHYWSSKYGPTRERELYARIKTTVASDGTAVALSQELQQASRLYAAILHTDHDFWSDYPRAVRTNLEVLGQLNLEQNRPLLLAAMELFPQKELTALLRRLVSWSVRGLIVGGIGGGTAERIYCEAAVKIRSGAALTTAAVAPTLSPIIYTDDEFRQSFEQARVTRAAIARYILNALEKTKRNKKEPELVPNEDEAAVNLEHVLPRNPVPAEWPQFTDEERRSYLHRIGNLTLLSKGPNGKIGNKPFADKKPILKASELALTQEAGADDAWTPDAISERQKRLAILALKTRPA